MCNSTPHTDKHKCMLSIFYAGTIDGRVMWIWKNKDMKHESFQWRTNVLNYSAILLLFSRQGVEITEVLIPMLSELGALLQSWPTFTGNLQRYGLRSRVHPAVRPHTDENRRHQAECGPNLFEISTPQYQHLVWHVLVISFSPLSVFVFGTVERVCLKRGFPIQPSLPHSFSQILSTGGGEGEKRCEEFEEKL